MDILIRAESRNNIKETHALNVLAFGQENEAVLVDALRKSSAYVHGLSLVAMHGNKIVGHILFTKIEIVDKWNNIHESLALAPMAVLPSYQGKGIGSRLVLAGLDKAKTHGFESVIVLGHEKFYPRFGFKPASEWMITAPFDVPDANFMAVELVSWAFHGVSGKVRYPKEFEGV